MTSAVSIRRLHRKFPVELVVAVESDAGLIESLLDDYLRELSEHRDAPVGATDATDYPYLDAYWSEPGRHAFIIKCRGSAVGFAFIRDPSSTRSDSHQVAEFYIKPGNRRLGIGLYAALAIWERFSGEWELQVHARNSDAVRFWASCVQAETSEPPQVQELQTEDGRRLQFNFRVGHAV